MEWFKQTHFMRHQGDATEKVQTLLAKAPQELRENEFFKE